MKVRAACGHRVDEDDRLDIQRKVGGNYRTAAGWRQSSICPACVERLIERLAEWGEFEEPRRRHGRLTIDNYGIGGVKAAGRTLQARKERTEA